MSNVAQDLLYLKSHEWAKIEGNRAKVGISDHAQNELGNIVFVNLPEVGDTVNAGEPFCDVESVKAVSDLYSPVTGTVVAVNEALEDAPELLNDDCYEAWIVEVEFTEQGDLMDAAAYEQFLAEEQ